MPTRLGLTFLHLCLVEVHCWSATSFFFGSGEEDAVQSHSDVDDDAGSRKSKRSLSSFHKFSHPISVDESITSRGRRDVEASVKASAWPTTIFSPLCEAWAYLEAGASIGRANSVSQTEDPEGKDSLAWKYLDVLVDQGGIPSLDIWCDESYDHDNHFHDSAQILTYQNSTDLAVRAVSRAGGSAISDLDGNMLPMALSLRAYSPHCEMHRSLARDAAISFKLYNTDTFNPPPAAFAVLSRVVKNVNGSNDYFVADTQVILDADLLPNALRKLKTENTPSMTKFMENVGSGSLVPLPDEKFHPQAEKDDEVVAILYGQVGTTAFSLLYQSLKGSHIKFVVRHMGYIPFEEANKMSNATRRASPTVLQGYGVRLDIRNVEYKAFDDIPDDKAKDGDTEPDWNDAGHQQGDPARNEFLAGVNLLTLMSRLHGPHTPPLPSDLQDLQTALIQSHSSQLRSESIVPPAWQRRPLSLQAATVIASSPDPLETLKGVSQNLPSVAHSLINVRVPAYFEELAEDASGLAAEVGAISPGWGDAAFGLYINNRLVDVERPSFNVFQLLDVIREEDKILQYLEAKVRPILKSTVTIMGRKEDDGTDPDWAALQSARKALDIGAEKLSQMGKNVKSVEDRGDNDEEKEDKNLYRIDVARGGKNSVLYLNDIEKDPEYKSWPSSMQEMFYRSQFGGAPTVRRNLFTMLIVVDPTQSLHPALGAVGQLLNAQFPLRLGVLIVNDEDVLNVSASKATPWNGGERSIHAQDSFLLLKYIYEEFGGTAAISCLIQLSHEVEEIGTMSAREYIDMHLAALTQMGLIYGGQKDRAQQKMDTLLKTGFVNEKSKLDHITYESAVQFASNKLVRSGMAFFNGLPLPDGSAVSFGVGMNKILQYEQRHIMQLAMKGIITDTTPKSIYASLLSGDKLFKQYHPLLKDTKGEYSSISSGSDWTSIMLSTTPEPTDYNKLDAIFVVEGVFNLDGPGIESAISFLDLISSPLDSWHDYISVSLGFRILSIGPAASPLSKVLSNIFCHASQFHPYDLKRLVKRLHEGTSHDNIADVIAAIQQIEDISSHTLQEMVESAASDKKCHAAKYAVPEETQKFYVANGRVYVPLEDAPISVSDIKMLVNLEIDRTQSITQMILPYLLPRTPADGEANNELEGIVIHHAMNIVTSTLNEIMSSSSSKGGDLASKFDSLQTEDGSPLYFSWNDKSLSSANLQVKVSVILDPLTEPTQRVAPLLLALRDFLKLPLRLILAPRKVVQNDVPLSSYYRFVADPTAFPESNLPKALFQNLPTNHLLTVRMDVPELWDVQQAYAIQDTDNLRCDSRGCGDEAHIMAHGVRGGKTAPTQVESTQIEYQLMSLLFFGQCYDVTKSTPPNGLQLTLDRSKTNEISKTKSTAEILPDGFQQLENAGQIEMETGHTDTLVMKTVGYWQLRANPGVWDLQIAKKSRGAEIYHMVEGTVRSGKIHLAKSSSESMKKKLVMKDFSAQGRVLLVKRRKGFEHESLFSEQVERGEVQEKNETVHIFSLATGHAYERLLKIMMLSVNKRTSSPVKFWLFENFLSPSFKSSAKFMAKQIGCEVEFVTYKWPEWLRSQSEKQRLIWGYKILFLDVLFPLDLTKIIYVDADQVVRGDMTELWNLDLDGAPYGYTPFCSSREETLGYQFWRTGFWQSHLQGRPYHISALYVVDLQRFRRERVGDKLRATYQSLSADPNSLANLDQDLPNYAQHEVRIFSLPQKWLWCESWCSDKTKAEAMTIDLCNNPEHKEAKITMAKRIISGPLFKESWEELDDEVAKYNEDYFHSLESEAQQ